MGHRYRQVWDIDIDFSEKNRGRDFYKKSMGEVWGIDTDRYGT